MIKKYKKYIFELILIIITIATDLLSKQWVFDFFEKSGKDSVVVYDSIFSFTKALNYGSSFGMLSGKTGLLLGMTTVFIIALFACLVVFRNTPTIFRIGMVLLFGGGIGNLVDRFAFGYVRDFIDYTFLDTFFGIKFAIGNVADIYCCIGLMLLIVYVLFQFEEKDFYSQKKLLELAKKDKEEI